MSILKGVTESYPYGKVWQEGLKVATKIKGSQEKPRAEWDYREHPDTTISPKSEVHGNHNEVLNRSLRRRASNYHRC